MHGVSLTRNLALRVRVEESERENQIGFKTGSRYDCLVSI